MQTLISESGNLPPPSILKAELLELLTEKRRRLDTNRISTLYPDEGPLRRELYPKHMQFFELGKTHNERCFMAANRVGKCVTAGTLIDTLSGPLAAGELFKQGQSFGVWAWDGEKRVKAQASAPFRKDGLHDCYRVTMSDGRWFEAADHHRVLTSDGFYFLDELHQAFSAGLLASSLGCGPSVHALGVPSLPETPLGYQVRYSAGCRQCGGPLREVRETARAWLPSPTDALRRSVAWLFGDGLARRRTSNRRLAFALQPSSGAFRPDAVQSAESGWQSDNTNAGLLCGFFQDAEPLPLGSSLRLQSGDEGSFRIRGIPLASLQLPNVDGTHIVSIDAIGRNVVYDFTVSEYHKYIAAGAVHHNTWGAGGYETALHLTGEYPDWWIGHRFDHPVDFWAAGDTSETTRDIVQHALMGPLGSLGTGLIPERHIIGEPTKRAGVAGAIDTGRIRHKSGGVSMIGFKSFDQGRKKFQGTAKHGIWLDEEPPADVYDECLVRLMTLYGLLMLTFTPLSGLSEVALRFLPDLAPEMT